METKTTVLEVDGMTCGSCIATVQRALREVDGVEHVDVRFRERKVLVRHSGDEAALIEVLREVGYAAR